MPGNFKKEDLKITKSYNAIINAMPTLLSRRNFSKITVNDICEEALVSRATFYVYFSDKYDLLNYWLKTLRVDFAKNTYKYTDEQLYVIINQFVQENTKIIINLVEDTNGEILKMLYDFMSSIIETTIEETENRKLSPNHIVLSNFCAGGMVNLILWQVKNRFPLETQLLNSYLHELIKLIIEWDSKQE